MKNKKVLIIVAVVLAISVLSVTAFATGSKVNGYDAFKELAKNHECEEFTNGTMTGTMKITDNGEEVINFVGTFNGNKDSEEMSGLMSISSGDFKKDLEIFKSVSSMYIVDVENNDVYVSEVTEDHSDYENESYRHEGMKDFDSNGEALFDYMFRDLKDNFSVENFSDGVQNISFELTKEEVPVPVNLMVSAMNSKENPSKSCELMMEENNLNIEDYPLLVELQELECHDTKLTENVELEYFKTTVKVNEEGNVDGFEFVITLTGNDEAGEFHKITVNANGKVSNLNNVAVQKVDLDGKNVIELPEHDGFKKHRRDFKTTH